MPLILTRANHPIIPSIASMWENNSIYVKSRSS